MTRQVPKTEKLIQRVRAGEDLRGELGTEIILEFRRLTEALDKAYEKIDAAKEALK